MENNFSIGNSWWFGLAIFLILLIGLSFIAKSDGPVRIWKGIIILGIMVFLGGIRTHLNNPSLDITHISNYEKASIFYGEIAEYPRTRSRTKTVVNIKASRISRAWQKRSGNLILYFPKNDTQAQHLKPGTNIVFSGQIIEIPSPANPNTFNYKAYLKNRKISGQVYLNDYSSYNVFLGNQINPIKTAALNMRHAMLEKLDILIQNEDHRAVLAAMTLGYKNQLDNELYQKFTDSGAVHVLAVSGLHVGVICWLFIMILAQWKNENKASKVIKLSILLSVVWFYTMLSGAAPAVQRAALMFSVFLIGKYWFDEVNVYNVLAFTALMLLIYDPYLIFQASFQFSFLSLLSIIYFQPLIGPLITPRSNLFQFIWNMASVAISAQILVFPITIYFFHKFPTYFILTGVLSVPLAIITLCAGLVTMLISFIYLPLAEALSILLKFLANAFIGSIELINSLPLSSLNQLSLSTIELIILSFLLLSIMIYLSKKQIVTLYSVGACIILFLGFRFHNSFQDIRNSGITIYNTNKGSLIDVKVGNKNYYLIEDLEEIDVKFLAENHRSNLGIDTNIELKDSFYFDSRIFWYKNTLTLKDHVVSFIRNKESYISDSTTHLVLYDNFQIFPDDMPPLDIDYLLLDSSIPHQVAIEWQKWANSIKVPYFNADEEAIILPLD